MNKKIILEEKILNKIKNEKKNYLQLYGKHLLIICILKRYNQGLYTDQLIHILEYNNKLCMSKPILNKTLNELINHNYIVKKKGIKTLGEKDFYIIKDIKSYRKTVIISNNIIDYTIQQKISLEDFKIYCLVEYLQCLNKNIGQKQISIYLKITQQSVQKHFKNLKEKINYTPTPFISLLDKYPQVDILWSKKNKNNPNEYISTNNKKVWWKCPGGKHDDFYRSINSSVISEFRCPECSQERTESTLQEKVRLYLESLHYTILHERNCSLIPQNPKIKNKHGQMPFDNEIKELHLLIETMGLQHYQELSKSNLWLDGKDPKETLHKRQLYDRYKKFIAYKNRYDYLAIPYWTDNDNETWKILINNKINEILKNKNNYYITTDKLLINYLKSLKFKYRQQDNKYIFNNSLKLYKCIQFYIKINKENEDCEVMSIC